MRNSKGGREDGRVREKGNENVCEKVSTVPLYAMCY